MKEIQKASLPHICYKTISVIRVQYFSSQYLGTPLCVCTSLCSYMRAHTRLCMYVYVLRYIHRCTLLLLHIKYNHFYRAFPVCALKQDGCQLKNGYQFPFRVFSLEWMEKEFGSGTEELKRTGILRVFAEFFFFFMPSVVHWDEGKIETICWRSPRHFFKKPR